MTVSSPLCLVTGATGYIGGRLVPELLAAGCRVRVLARHPDRLRDHPWTDDVEIVQADVSDPADARSRRWPASTSPTTWSTRSGTAAFESTDRADARRRSPAAARDAGVGRLVYLGGLHPDRAAAGTSRRTCARATRSARSCSPRACRRSVLRAAVIIGSGSASFEMLRYLTERLPAMITPRWVTTRIQPIAIRDVLRYLVGCAAAARAT